MQATGGQPEALARPTKPGAKVAKTLAWLGVLLVASYAPVLWRMVRQWYNDPDMSHGFFVPVVAGYIVWKRRDLLLAEQPKPSWWGVALAGYGGLQLMIATLGAELFLARTAFIVSLAGVVLTVGGWRWLKAMAFPLFLLCFMVPIPAIVYNQITFPMQLVASQTAAAVLSFLGIPVLQEGNILELPSQRLNVVEACSGIRSLLSLSFLALVYGWFFDRKAWMRGLLLVAAVPIAIVSNASRVALTGILSEIDTDLASGAFHYFSGWVVFLVALILMVGLHKGVNLVYGGLRRSG